MQAKIPVEKPEGELFHWTTIRHARGGWRPGKWPPEVEKRAKKPRFDASNCHFLTQNTPSLHPFVAIEQARAELDQARQQLKHS